MEEVGQKTPSGCVRLLFAFDNVLEGNLADELKSNKKSYRNVFLNHSQLLGNLVDRLFERFNARLNFEFSSLSLGTLSQLIQNGSIRIRVADFGLKPQWQCCLDLTLADFHRKWGVNYFALNFMKSWKI